MVGEPVAANRALVDAGRADIRLASVGALPFGDAAFDRAVGINTLYVRPDPVRGLAELRRVLKPQGRLFLACATPETAATSPFTKTEFGFAIHGGRRILELHRAAGFSDVTIEPCSETGRRVDGTFCPRHYLFSIARP